MALFVLDTESVSSSSDSLKTVSSEISSLSSSVSGYDVNCEESFNFSGAKQVISQNIEACANKVSNTSKLLETVVTAHNNLQSQLKFDKGEEKKSNNSDSSSNHSSDYSNDYSSGSGSRHSGSGRHYSDGSSSNSSSRSSYSGGGYSNNSSSAAGVLSSTAGLNVGGAYSFVNSQSNNSLLNNQENNSETTSSLLNGKLLSVGYATPNDDTLNEDSKRMLNTGKLTYKNGYAVIDGRYVVSCDSSYGKVGDVIRFTKNDGSVVECVIGINTFSDKYKSSLNFIVDGNNPPTSKSDFFDKIIVNSSNIENVSTANGSFNSSNNLSDSSKVDYQVTSEEEFKSTDTSSTNQDKPVTDDVKLTPTDSVTSDVSLAANSSASFSDENLDSLINAKSDEDIQKVVESIINSTNKV